MCVYVHVCEYVRIMCMCIFCVCTVYMCTSQVPVTMVTGIFTHLAGGQFPWLTKDLCQEGRFDLEVL